MAVSEPTASWRRFGTVRRLLPAALLLVVGSACATAARDPFGGADTATSQLRVYVENRGFTDVRVYARTSRGQELLGQLGAQAHLTVDLPWRDLDQIGFRIEVVAGRTYTTEALAVSAGQRVELIIPDDPRNAIVRRG
jgi:hypothetical protein